MEKVPALTPVNWQIQIHQPVGPVRQSQQIPSSRALTNHKGSLQKPSADKQKVSEAE